MENTFSIIIKDENDQLIGELMQATSVDIIKYIEKGFVVLNKINHNVITLDDIKSTIGVSDGLINIE